MNWSLSAPSSCSFCSDHIRLLGVSEGRSLMKSGVSLLPGPLGLLSISNGQSGLYMPRLLSGRGSASPISFLRKRTCLDSSRTFWKLCQKEAIPCKPSSYCKHRAVSKIIKNRPPNPFLFAAYSLFIFLPISTIFFKILF